MLDFSEKPYQLFQGDCLEVLRRLPDNCISAVCTDPPYGLSQHSQADIVKCLQAWLAGEKYEHGKAGFMNRNWDSFVPGPEVWREVLRVLKPGGHLLAFAGTRSMDLMSMAVRLAGFELRDAIGSASDGGDPTQAPLLAWCYASGFPKSLNLDRLRGDKICGCSEPYAHNHGEEKPQHNLRTLRNSDVSKAKCSIEGRGKILQPSVQEQGAPIAGRAEFSTAEVRCGESFMEGRGDASPSARELRAGSVCEGACGCVDHGSEGRLCDGAPLGDGEVDRADSATDGGCASRRPRPAEQFTAELGAVAGQSESQALGAWTVCGGCGLPRVPTGLGTSLKPAWEPIILARKPMIGTVAQNVLEHGTGAINIDACRVPFAGDDDEQESKGKNQHATLGTGARQNNVLGNMGQNDRGNYDAPGRWPANLIHDGSPEVVAHFPDSLGAGGSVPNVKVTGYGDGIGGGKSDYLGGERTKVDSGSGSAARFFYCAKASRRDRNEGLASSDEPAVARGATMREQEDADWSKRNGNHHPTVKPTDLMAYLVRLVTPPGGVVLDPFLGSGSTGKAAIREGFRFIGCELSPEYLEIARARIQFEVDRRLASEAAAAAAAPVQRDLFSAA